MNALGRVIPRSFSEGGLLRRVSPFACGEAPEGATPVKAWGSTITAPAYERFDVMWPVPQGWLREMLQARINVWGGWHGLILVAIYCVTFPIWFFWVFDPWVESHVRKALARVWR